MTNKDIYEQERGISRLIFIYNEQVCLILRSPEMGHLCGYVGLTSSHSLYGLHYDEINQRINPTSELTWSGKRLDIGLPSLYSDLYWVGFDCGHYNEYIPLMPFGKQEDIVYRDIPYVMKECMALADLLEK